MKNRIKKIVLIIGTGQIKFNKIGCKALTKERILHYKDRFFKIDLYANFFILCHGTSQISQPVESQFKLYLDITANQTIIY